MTTTAAVTVRRAASAEFEAIGELCVESYCASGHLSPEDDYAKTLRDARARALAAELLVAVRDDTVIGTVTICPSGSAFAEIGRDGESEFRFLAVAPAAWRTGVGEALVDACEERARELGASAQVICVVTGNEGAHRLYRRLGFERLPERDWEPRLGIHLQAYRRTVPFGA